MNKITENNTNEPLWYLQNQHTLYSQSAPNHYAETKSYLSAQAHTCPCGTNGLNSTLTASSASTGTIGCTQRDLPIVSGTNMRPHEQTPPVHPALHSPQASPLDASNAPHASTAKSPIRTTPTTATLVHKNSSSTKPFGATSVHTAMHRKTSSLPDATDAAHATAY